MGKILFSNNASTKLAAVLDSSSTSLTVYSGTGTLFPDILAGSGDFFLVTVIDQSGDFEIIKVTARVGDTFTIVRAQENTVAVPFATDSTVELRLTAGGLNSFAASSVSPNVGSAVGVLPIVNGGTGNTVGTAVHATTATDATKWAGSTKYVSTAAPSGGVNGDIWFQYI